MHRSLHERKNALICRGMWSQEKEKLLNRTGKIVPTQIISKYKIIMHVALITKNCIIVSNNIRELFKYVSFHTSVYYRRFCCEANVLTWSQSS